MRSFQTLLVLLSLLIGCALDQSEPSYARAVQTNEYAILIKEPPVLHMQTLPHQDLRLMRIGRHMLTICDLDAASVLAVLAFANNKALLTSRRQVFIDSKRCIVRHTVMWQPNRVPTLIGEVSDDGSPIRITIETRMVLIVFASTNTMQYQTAHVVCWQTPKEKHCF